MIKAFSVTPYTLTEALAKEVASSSKPLSHYLYFLTGGLGNVDIRSMTIENIDGSSITGENILLTADNITNDSSLIAANKHLLVDANNVTNAGSSDFGGIYAKDSLLMNVGGEFNNSSLVRANAIEIYGSVNNIDDGDIVPGFTGKVIETLPHLFDTDLYSDIGGRTGFLYEINPELTSYDTSLFSRAFLHSLDIDLADVTLIGDDHYMAMLIGTAVHSTLGEYFLAEQAGDLNELAELYENTRLAMIEHDFAFGDALPDFAVIDKPIMIFELQNVSGQDVYVPKIILPDEHKFTEGGLAASIKGIDDLFITGRNIDNNGRIESDSSMFFNSTGSFSGNGSLHAAEDIFVSAGDIVFGRDLHQTSSKRRIRSKLVGEGSIAADGLLFMQSENDIIFNAAKISSGLDTVLIAGNDILFDAVAVRNYTYSGSSDNFTITDIIINYGTDLHAYGDLIMASGNDITISASNVSADEDVFIGAGRDFNMGKLDSNGNVIEVQDRDYYYHYEKDDGFLGSGIFGGTTIIERDTRTTVPPVLNVGGDLLPGDLGLAALSPEDAAMQISGRDINIAGGIITVGGNAFLVADRHFNMLETYNSSYSRVERSKSGFLSSSKAIDETNKITVVRPALYVGGDLLMQSGADMNLRAVDIRVLGDTDVLVGGSLDIMAGRESYSSFHLRESSGFFAGSSGGIGLSVGFRKEKHRILNSQDMAIVSNITSGNDLNILAFDTLYSEATFFAAGNDINMQAGGDLDLMSASDLLEYHEYHKITQVALSVSINEHISGNIQNIADSAGSFDDGKGSNLNKGVTAVSSAIKAAQSVIALVTGNLVSLDTSLSRTSTKSTFDMSQSNAVVSEVIANNDISITSGEDITMAGTSIGAGNNLEIAALGDVDIISAENLYSARSKFTENSQGMSGSIGVGLQGITGSGSVNLAMAKSKSNQSSTTHTNAILGAGNNIDISSGNDTLIRGANINAGNELNLNTGGNLTISSIQNTWDLSGSNSSRSFGLSMRTRP